MAEISQIYIEEVGFYDLKDTWLRTEIEKLKQTLDNISGQGSESNA